MQNIIRSGPLQSLCLSLSKGRAESTTIIFDTGNALLSHCADRRQSDRKRSAEALQIVCAESCEHRKKSHLLQGCSQWTTIRTT
jgi:hypothetical protein